MIQYRTNGFPVAASDWEIYFMVREDEIPSSSMDVEGFPRYFWLMTEHSMCQPGLPFPQGLSRKAPRFARLPQAKSRGFFFFSSIQPRASLHLVQVSL